MKKHIYTLAACLTAALLAASCNSLLDINTKHALDESKIRTEEGCEGLIVGVYDLMQSPTYTARDLICLPDVMGDNLQPTPGASRYNRQYNFIPRYHMDIWGSAYELIESLNEALEILNTLPTTDKAKAIRGEALFLRAYNYFYLAAIYGRMPGHEVQNFNLCVPLITKPFFNDSDNVAESSMVARANVETVWKAISDDLNEAYECLANTKPTGSVYRVSAMTVKALQSRVYLYMGEWRDAIDAADFVIKNSGVDIYAGTYTDVFSKGRESLWQLHFTETESLASSSLHSMYGTVDNGNRDAEGYGDGKGAGDAQLSVTPDFMALIDMDQDTRAGALRKVHFNGQNLWWSTKFNSWGGQFGLDDIPLIRISEIYLNRAEAYAHLNDISKARADVNLLRNKRGLTDTDVPDSGVLEEVLLQRRIELAFEGHRFFDLKRLGKDIARPAGMPTIPYDDYRVVASIGTSELDVNTLLVNNPGY